MGLTLNKRPTALSRRQALTAGLAIGGAALAFGLSRANPAVETAANQLRAAAGQRPVSRTDQIVRDYQEAVRRSPQSADARAILAGASIQKARETGDPSYYGKSAQMIDEALAINPEHLDALIGKGALALARHQFREALAIGEQARALNGRVPQIYGVIADAQLELGMYDEAVATIQTMVNMRPDLSSYTRVSYARELYGEVDGAIEAMGMALRAGSPAVENVEWTRSQLGNLHFGRGDLAGAEQVYLTSLQRDPQYVFALAGLARVRAAQGSYNQAVELYRAAIARVPLPEFVIALGELAESAGQHEEAARQYQLVRAMQQLFRANGVDTDLELALFEADHGADPQAALAIARLAFERRPGIKAADTLAWALYRAGRHDEAAGYAEQALRLGTRDAAMLFHAGMIAAARGERAAARGYLDQALALNPYFSPLQAPLAHQTLAGLA
jgi:tetratricopeptide (TPR) repeat protein